MWYGDQTQEAYSRSGLTYTIKARTNVAVSLEVKHLYNMLPLTGCEYYAERGTVQGILCGIIPHSIPHHSATMRIKCGILAYKPLYC